MKKVFGMITLMLMFVGVTMSAPLQMVIQSTDIAPTVDVAVVEVQIEIVTDVTLESSTVLTFEDVDNPLLCEVENIEYFENTGDLENLESFEPDLETDNIQTIIDAETLNKYDETEVVATPLLTTSLTDNAPLFANNEDTILETEVLTKYDETEVVDTTLTSDKLDTLSTTTTTTNLQEVLLEYI